MRQDSKAVADLQFSNEDIRLQINRIFLSSVFSRSVILRRFLSFIVEETILGHTGWLKEYTIAVKVLDKPIDFKPQDNCVVRIHASRLRRALNSYYLESGAMDNLRISIPKGSYIPIFNDRSATLQVEMLEEAEHLLPHNISIAVVPFNHYLERPLENSFSEGLGLQLSTALMQCGGFSVISYHVIGNILGSTHDIMKIESTLNPDYIITGNVQTLENRARIFIQLIDTSANKQIWSKMYDRVVTFENIFDLQDEIVAAAVPELQTACNIVCQKPAPLRLAAVC